MFEGLKLAMHVSNSKHFAKEIGRLVLIIKHDQENLSDDDKQISKAIQQGNAQAIHDIFMHFIELCGHDSEIIRQMETDENIIEHRVVKDVQAVQQKFEDLENNSVLEHFSRDAGADKVIDQLKEDLKKIHQWVGQIVDSIKDEKMKACDLKRDHKRMRDRSLWTSEWLYHSIKVQAKAEASAARDESKLKDNLFSDVDNLLKLLSKQHNHDSEKFDLKQIRTLVTKVNLALNNFIEDIKKELKSAIEIEKDLVILSFRLRDLNEEELRRLPELMQRGYPHALAEEVRQEELKYLETLNDAERDAYHEVAAIHRQAKHL